MSHGSYNSDGKCKWTVLLQQMVSVGGRRVAKSISVLKALWHMTAKTCGLIFCLTEGFLNMFCHRTLLPGNCSFVEHYWQVMFGQVRASSHWHRASLQIRNSRSEQSAGRFEPPLGPLARLWMQQADCKRSWWAVLRPDRPGQGSPHFLFQFLFKVKSKLMNEAIECSGREIQRAHLAGKHL